MASAPWALGMAAAATTSFVRTGVLAHIMHERLCNRTGEKERSTKKQQTTKKKVEKKKTQKKNKKTTKKKKKERKKDPAQYDYRQREEAFHINYSHLKPGVYSMCPA